MAETLAFLTVRPVDDVEGRWVADAPPWFGDYLFGGVVIAQAIMAATRDAPAGRRLHSLHGYFLRPAMASTPTTYDVRPIREGRSFTSRHLEASQGGKVVLDLSCSFTADTEGYVYDLGGDVPPRDEAAVEQGPGPWVAQRVGPTTPDESGSMASTHRMWFRVPEPLPDDVHLHTALLGFATDWTGVGGRPLDLEHDTTGMVSLDHAAWFHRPTRADEWLFYDVQAVVNAGGRGLLRGVMRDEAGRVVVSVAQEMRLTVLEPS